MKKKVKDYSLTIWYEGHDEKLDTSIHKLCPSKYDGCGFDLFSGLREHFFFNLTREKAKEIALKSEKLSSYYNIHTKIS